MGLIQKKRAVLSGCSFEVKQTLKELFLNGFKEINFEQRQVGIK